MNPTFYFDYNNLADVDGFAIDSIVIDPIKRDNQTYDIAHGNGTIPTVSLLRDRQIVVRGHFTGDYESTRLAQRTLDSYITGVNKTVQFDVAGDMVTGYGTLQAQRNNEPKGGYLETTLIFDIHDGTLLGEELQSYTYTGVDSANYSGLTVMNNGSYVALPTIKMTIQAVSTTNDSDDMTLISNGVPFVVQQSLVAGDIIHIDSALKTTRLNGYIIGAEGSYPEIATGSQSFTYTDSFSTRNVDIEIEFRERY